jgi:outer membrane receptor for ferrienterochelin and colicin
MFNQHKPISKVLNAITIFCNPTIPKTGVIIGVSYVQDEIELVDNSVWLTIGSKLEHNDYTGFEGQPSARLMWAPTLRQRLWGAFSRSARTPPPHAASMIAQPIWAHLSGRLSPNWEALDCPYPH